MERIKIAYLIDSLKRAGAQKILYDICSKIDKDKFDVTLVYWKEGNFKDNFLGIKDINVIKLKNNTDKVSKIKKPLIFFKQVSELINLQKKEKFDIIHSHLIFPNIYASFLKRKFKRLKTISTKHNTGNFNKLFYRFFGKIVDSKFDIITTCSKSVADIFRKHYLNVVCIYNAADLEKINLAEKMDYGFISKDKINIVSVGRLTEQKGFDHLIKTFKIIEEKIPANLVIIGEGEKRSELEQLINKFGLEGKVHLIGERGDVYSILKSSGIFVLLSNWEGFGIVVIEAMACDLPIIGSDVDGIGEIINNNENGFLVNRFDYQNTSDKIMEIINNPELKQKFVSNGEKTVKNRFEINKIIKEYEDLYLNLRGKI